MPVILVPLSAVQDSITSVHASDDDSFLVEEQCEKLKVIHKVLLCLVTKASSVTFILIVSQR